jgi:hypothetical protein
MEFQTYSSSSSSSSSAGRSRIKPKKSQNRSKSQHEPKKVHLHGLQFINVNYKFLVDNNADLNPQLLDPNVAVNIDDIARVISPGGNSCPICLSDEIVAPRMITSCGHILCLKCLLSLLDSEVPTAKKREANAIVEKYKECPLCQTIIRRSEVLPVLILKFDTRFETPKVDEDVIMSLMMRPSGKVLAIPKSLHDIYGVFPDFPWYGQEPDLLSYSRIVRGDLETIKSMYEAEKNLVLAQFEQEKLVYNEDPKFVSLTIDNINQDIVNWQDKFSKSAEKTTKKKHSGTSGSSHNDHGATNTFYFYQTGFNTTGVYVLSPLDMKVLKTAYHHYEGLPSSIVAKIEKIRYEELTSETSMTKYKYLSHLPVGTQIGFLECNWHKNEYIDQNTWKIFLEDLLKRTKNSRRKLRKEEQDRKRALEREEIKTKKFYERENAGTAEESYDYATGAMGTLTIIDNRELPPLTADSTTTGTSSEVPGEFQTTIWGTRIPKAEPSPSDEDEDFEAEEMIRRAQEEMKKLGEKGKRKKKRLVLTSTM